MKKVRRAVRTLVISLMAVAILSMSAITVNADGASTLTKESVKEYLDRFVQEKMEEYNIPSVGISVVYKGEVILSEAYGYQDMEKQILADEDVSMYSIGSASKPFCFTAAMQLVEQGKLRLTDKLSDYIDFEIETNYDEPILISDLFNHCAGWEEKVYNLKANTYEEILTIGEWLKKNQPEQVRAPRTYNGYSNYGVLMLAHVVEKISGMNYNDYLEENILKPLGLENTVIDQKITGNEVRGYTYNPATGEYLPAEDEFWQVGPAGAMKSTPSEMAIFMLAHLNGGQYNGYQMLEPETVELMHSTSYIRDERANGMAHGFIEGDFNGYDFISHGGTTSYQFTGMTMFDELELGIYSTGNSVGVRALNSELPEVIVDHFFESKLVAPVFSDDVDLARFEGTYHMTRSGYSSFEKIVRWMNNTVFTVRGDVLVSDSGKEYKAVDSLLLVSLDGNTRLAFEEDENGKLLGYTSSASPIKFNVLEHGLDDVGTQLMLAMFMAGLLALSILIRLIVWIKRKVKKQIYEPKERRTRIFNTLHTAYVVIASGILAFQFFTLPLVEMMKGNVTSIKIMLVLTTLVLPSTVFNMLNLVKAWSKKYFSVGTRIHETVVTIASIAISAFLIYWNLFGWQF